MPLSQAILPRVGGRCAIEGRGMQGLPLCDFRVGLGGLRLGSWGEMRNLQGINNVLL